MRYKIPILIATTSIFLYLLNASPIGRIYDNLTENRERYYCPTIIHNENYSIRITTSTKDSKLEKKLAKFFK